MCVPMIIIIHGFYIVLFSALEQTHCVHGLNKICSFIVIITSTNKYGNTKAVCLLGVIIIIPLPYLFCVIIILSVANMLITKETKC